MASLAFQLLLILGLVLCPFRCQVVRLCAAGAGAQSGSSCRSCSACCQPEPVSSTGEPVSPVQDSEDPTGGPCRGICSGAVIDKSDRAGLLDELHVATQPVERASAHRVAALPSVSGWQPAPPASGVNVGRALCTLHSSWLC